VLIALSGFSPKDKTKTPAKTINTIESIHTGGEVKDN
jgi:hypothetical protein